MSINLGIVLDVAIGMVFTYALLAIVVSGLQEVVAGWLNLRGERLKNGIRLLLEGKTPDQGTGSDLFARVFGHGLIEDISSRGKPAYVPSRNFALAVVEALKDGSQGPLFSQIENSVARLPDGAARETLTAFVTQAAGDVEELKKSIATWFDDGMDRLSGAYKRHTQLWMLAIGFAVAVALNIDSLALVRTLSTDDKARAQTVAMAETYMKSRTEPGTVTPEAAKAAKEMLDSLPLQFGWHQPAALPGERKSAWDLFKSAFRPASPKDGWRGEGVWMVVGWLLSALAAALGAPYWFALLQQLLELRNAGPKPPATTPEKGQGQGK